MRAEIERVNVRVQVSKDALKKFVNGVHIFRGIQSESDPTLIGDNNYAHSDLIQASNGFGRARQNVEVIGCTNVLAFGHLLVNDAITVQKDGLNA